MLTAKQLELLTYINARIAEDGIAPSFDEMKEAMGLKSKSGIHRLVAALVERGFLRQLAHKARAVEVVRLPDAVQREAESPLPAAPQPGFRPRVVEGDQIRDPIRRTGKVPAPELAAIGEIVALPLLGRIAAGTPIEALSHGHQTIDVPVSIMPQGGEFYALTVAGDSMVEAGIFDGDTVIIRRTEAAETGQIIVALVDEHEVTLKRLRRKTGAVALEPANPAHETRIYRPDRVKIQGRLVALLRQYQ